MTKRSLPTAGKRSLPTAGKRSLPTAGSNATNQDCVVLLHEMKFDPRGQTRACCPPMSGTRHHMFRPICGRTASDFVHTSKFLTRPPTVLNISTTNLNSFSIWKGGCPCSTSTKVIPVDHTSLGRAYVCPPKYFGCSIIHRHHFGCHWLFGRLVQTKWQYLSGASKIA